MNKLVNKNCLIIPQIIVIFVNLLFGFYVDHIFPTKQQKVPNYGIIQILGDFCTSMKI